MSSGNWKLTGPLKKQSVGPRILYSSATSSSSASSSSALSRPAEEMVTPPHQPVPFSVPGAPAPTLLISTPSPAPLVAPVAAPLPPILPPAPTIPHPGPTGTAIPPLPPPASAPAASAPTAQEVAEAREQFAYLVARDIVNYCVKPEYRVSPHSLRATEGWEKRASYVVADRLIMEVASHLKNDRYFMDTEKRWDHVYKFMGFDGKQYRIPNQQLAHQLVTKLGGSASFVNPKLTDKPVPREQPGMEPSPPSYDSIRTRPPPTTTMPEGAADRPVGDGRGGPATIPPPPLRRERSGGMFRPPPDEDQGYFRRASGPPDARPLSDTLRRPGRRMPFPLRGLRDSENGGGGGNTEEPSLKRPRLSGSPPRTIPGVPPSMEIASRPGPPPPDAFEKRLSLGGQIGLESLQLTPDRPPEPRLQVRGLALGASALEKANVMVGDFLLRWNDVELFNPGDLQRCIQQLGEQFPDGSGTAWLIIRRGAVDLRVQVQPLFQAVPAGGPLPPPAGMPMMGAPPGSAMGPPGPTMDSIPIPAYLSDTMTILPPPQPNVPFVGFRAVGPRFNQAVVLRPRWSLGVHVIKVQLRQVASPGDFRLGIVPTPPDFSFEAVLRDMKYGYFVRDDNVVISPIHGPIKLKELEGKFHPQGSIFMLIDVQKGAVWLSDNGDDFQSIEAMSFQPGLEVSPLVVVSDPGEFDLSVWDLVNREKIARAIHCIYPNQRGGPPRDGGPPFGPGIGAPGGGPPGFVEEGFMGGRGAPMGRGRGYPPFRGRGLGPSPFVRSRGGGMMGGEGSMASRILMRAKAGHSTIQVKAPPIISTSSTAASAQKGSEPGSAEAKPTASKPADTTEGPSGKQTGPQESAAVSPPREGGEGGSRGVEDKDQDRDQETGSRRGSRSRGRRRETSE